MIEAMQKYSFLVYHKDYPDFLEQLRDLGVVHVVQKQADVSDAVRSKYETVRLYDSAIKFLGSRNPDGQKGTTHLKGEEVLEKLATLHSEMENRKQQLGILSKELVSVTPWGDFSTETIQRLKDNSLHLRYFICSERKYDPQWEAMYPIEVVQRTGGFVYFILLESGANQEITIDADEARAPEKPYSQLVEYIDKVHADINRIEKEYDLLAATSIDVLNESRKELIERTDYQKVVESTQSEADDKVKMLEGWAPLDQVPQLEAFLEENKILHLSARPEQEDKVPILLKNNKFAKKFELIGDLYSLPKYGELDLTPFFAPFYTLFFGFCLGDAGYGILITLLAFIARPRLSKELKGVASLVAYLGLSTIFFGIIGGTFFGIPLYETSLPVYKDLALMFKERNTDINSILFALSLVLGGVQIVFGMFVKVVNESIQFGWKVSIGTMGWILLILGGASIALLNKFAGIPMETLKPFLYALLGISGVLILLLNNLKRNVLMNVGLGLWDSYNMVTGLLGDLLSYIRLFALGISSSILGFVFNSLALSMKDSIQIPVVNIVVMIVILLIGHGINIFMSGLGSFVHPMRLTFVEFYKNSGFSGGGKRYSPFKKN